jgi:hypothetical protein
MKIVKHTFCHLGDKCPLIGKEATVEETIKASGEPEQIDYQPEWYWAKVDGMQHKFQKGDLE